MLNFANWFAGIFGSLFALVAHWFTARAALFVTIAAVSLSLTLGLFVAIKALVAGVLATVPFEPFVMGFYACWPGNAETCMAACFGADVAVFIYRYKVGLIEALAK